MAQVQSSYVISSLQRQLGEAAMKIAMLEAQLMELGASAPPQEPLLVVPADAEQG